MNMDDAASVQLDLLFYQRITRKIASDWTFELLNGIYTKTLKMHQPEHHEEDRVRLDVRIIKWAIHNDAKDVTNPVKKRVT